MEYRIQPKTGEKISVIGIGTGTIWQTPEDEAVKALEYACQSGINYIDLATAGSKTFTYVGKALACVRKKIFYQIHFGADYSSGEYGWTTDLDAVKRQIDKILTELKTDYIDYGFIHCLDTDSDWADYQKNGVFDYLIKLKDSGIVRHIGLSSHTPKLANTILDLGIIDQLMFSVNPAYDYQHGEFASGSGNERMGLYRRCESEGIGIAVMKPYSGGQLLNADTSPFSAALTKIQCIKYALDKPGVLTVLPGIRDLADIKEILHYFEASEEELDYSLISKFTPKDMNGVCVYCNHCRPCPAGLNIGLINKYYDLAKMGDPMAADHYKKLPMHASNCIACGHCDSRCPFNVRQTDRMEKIASFFGF